jgi:hypothetical protein
MSQLSNLLVSDQMSQCSNLKSYQLPNNTSCKLGCVNNLNKGSKYCEELFKTVCDNYQQNNYQQNNYQQNNNYKNMYHNNIYMFDDGIVICNECLSKICFNCRKYINFDKYTNIKGRYKKSMPNELEYIPTNVSDFDINKFSYNKNFFPQYDNKQFVFITDKLQLTTPCILHIKPNGSNIMTLRFNSNQINHLNFKNMLSKIDIVNNVYKKTYKYYGLIKEKKEEYSDDYNNSHIKLNFSSDRDTNKLLTLFFKKNGNNTERLDIENITDLKKYLVALTNIKIVASVDKLYINDTYKTCYQHITILQMEIEEYGSLNNNVLNSKLSKYSFIDHINTNTNNNNNMFPKMGEPLKLSPELIKHEVVLIDGNTKDIDVIVCDKCYEFGKIETINI